MASNLRPEPELRRKAETDCRALLKQHFKQEPLIEVLHSQTEWDDSELRHIYEYEAQVWLAAGEFDVILDETTRPVGYVDHSKWRNCAWEEFPRSRVVPLAAETGFVPPNSLLIGYTRGTNGSVEARLLTEPSRADSPRYVVRINPVLGRVISVVPEGMKL